MEPLTVFPYKLSDGAWAFDHEHQNTIGEGLLNGTEKALDGYFKLVNPGEEPVKGSRLRVVLDVLSRQPKFDEMGTQINTLLTLIKTDENGSTYLEHRKNFKVWLCPWLQGYFGYVPDAIFVTVTSWNPPND